MIKETEQLRNHLSEAEEESERLKVEEARVCQLLSFCLNQFHLLLMLFKLPRMASSFKLS